MDYLSDGISESLINNLSQLSSLKVISRGSVFKYKGKDFDPQEVARTLGVQAIVTGRVMQNGDQLQVSAELVNVSDKTQMWGEQFNRKATDTLAVQAEISQQIAENLRLAAHIRYAAFLTRMGRVATTRQSAKSNGPESLIHSTISWSLNLGYIYYFARQYSQAVEQFKQTLEMDNNLGNAHTGAIPTMR
jgi:TolB-like protein